QREGPMIMSTSASQIRPDGTFTLSGVAPGEYMLRANAMGGLGEIPEFASARVDVAGEDINGVQLVGMKPVSVTGRILLPPALVQSFQASTVRVVTQL